MCILESYLQFPSIGPREEIIKHWATTNWQQGWDLMAVFGKIDGFKLEIEGTYI